MADLITVQRMGDDKLITLNRGHILMAEDTETGFLVTLVGGAVIVIKEKVILLRNKPN